jgi:3-deoxy-D-manno-octulosonate 8-phosphate phosphatase (KDO 8-P phosphatase)
MGDDLPDLAAIRHAGLGATVKDATPAVLAQADWISQYRGGNGAVREFCEQLLAAQGKLDNLLARYTLDLV